MLPLWLACLIIVLILAVDVLLIIGIISASITLVIALLLGISLRIAERKVNDYLAATLGGSGLERAVYPLVRSFFDLFPLWKGMPAVIAAGVYILFSLVALFAINAALVWLLFTNVL